MPGDLRWTALRYRLTTDSAVRVAVWRALRAARGVKLSPGHWAFGHDEHDEPGIADVARLIVQTGGVAETSVVDPANPSFWEMNERLRVVCERSWADFFNDVDRLSFVLDGSAECEKELDELRLDYQRLLVDDLAVSGALRRGGDRLDDLADRFWVATTTAGPRAITAGAGTRRERRQVEVTSSRATNHDDVRYIVRVDPLPPVGWELEFAAFEAMLYRDPPAHTLRHGCFVVTCQHRSLGPTLDILRRRLHRYEQFLS